MLKIALSGKMHAGKTTVAKYIAHNYDATTFSFAERLKINLASIGVDRVSLCVVKPPLVRQLMQLYGRVMREQDRDYWVRAVLAQIQAEEDDIGAAIGVIDDLRFTNEAQILLDEGFFLVRVTCADDDENFDYEAQDISEIDLDDWPAWDYEIKAKRGDFHELFAQTDRMMRDLMLKQVGG